MIAPPSHPDLFAAVPSTKSVSSRATACSISREAAAKRRREVLLVLRAAFPRELARFQIANTLGLPESRISSSVDALIKLGDIEETGRTTTNPETGRHPALLVARPWMENARG